MVDFLPLSVAVEDAYEAERKGDQKKEFEILQSHLNDLSFNKAQVVAQLENDEVHIMHTYMQLCTCIYTMQAANC